MPGAKENNDKLVKKYKNLTLTYSGCFILKKLNIYITFINFYV